jgi:hypothetical protein
MTVCYRRLKPRNLGGFEFSESLRLTLGIRPCDCRRIDCVKCRAVDPKMIQEIDDQSPFGINCVSKPRIGDQWTSQKLSIWLVNIDFLILSSIHNLRCSFNCFWMVKCSFFRVTPKSKLEVVSEVLNEDFRSFNHDLMTCVHFFRSSTLLEIENNENSNPNSKPVDQTVRQ